MKQVKSGLVLFLIIFVLLFLSFFEGWCDSVVEANNRFALDLYAKIRNKKDNIFFSPYSISTALAMTYEGARGKTREEMKKVFYFPEESKGYRKEFLELLNEINKKDKRYQLYTANALWVEKTYKVLDEYLKTIEKYYQGKAINVGFIDNSERLQSCLMINQWVREHTNNKIREIIKPQELSKDTRLILTNAIFFKGNWKIKFDKDLTKEEDFKITSDKNVKVQMMRLAGKFSSEGRINYPKFSYAETDELQALELPYEGDELSMLILLPKRNLEDVEKNLNLEKIENIKKRLTSRRVEVYIPKLKYEKGYQLNQTLSEMGMPTAFTDRADFSGISGQSDLKIGDVIHKAFVEVNEEGTEAAGATGVEMVSKLSVLKPEEPVTFRADHPFIFIIQHNKTGAILFMGRVYNPNER